MDLCVVLYGSMEHKWHEGRKDLNSTKKMDQGKKPRTDKKK
jgi:hypothetical protein